MTIFFASDKIRILIRSALVIPNCFSNAATSLNSSSVNLTFINLVRLPSFNLGLPFSFLKSSMKKMSCEFFQFPPGGQETFCETKRHLAVAKTTEILIINLGFQPLNKKLGG